MATLKNFDLGTRVRVHGKPVTGLGREETDIDEGPMQQVQGFVYFVSEAGRGWSANNAYFTTAPYLEGIVETRHDEKAVKLDEQFGAVEYEEWAVRPYKRKDGSASPNIRRIHNHLDKYQPSKIGTSSIYGICPTSTFANKNLVEAI